MKLPAEIVAALSQFPAHEFCARDIGRRFKQVRQEHVQHALSDLARTARIQRRMRYGVFYYRAAA